jgi:hypothetical protein
MSYKLRIIDTLLPVINKHDRNCSVLNHYYAFGNIIPEIRNN